MSVEVARLVAERLKPRRTPYDPADLADSACMTVVQSPDGSPSMRALTFREVFEAIEAEGYVLAQLCNNCDGTGETGTLQTEDGPRAYLCDECERSGLVAAK